MNVVNPFLLSPNVPDCDEFEERAAIMEFDGNLTREEAEREATKLLGIAKEIISPSFTEQLIGETESDYYSNERADGTHPQAGKEDKPKWVYTGAELLEMPLTKPPCIVKPILQTTGFSLLIGESDVGKTWLALGLLLAVASGHSEWLGYALNLTYKRAILISTEDSEYNLSGRFHTLQKSYDPGQWRDRVRVLIADDKSNAEILAELKRMIAMEPVDLIIMDCYGDLFDGRDGNSQAETRKWFKFFVSLSKECHVMLLHHKGKRLADKTPHKDHALGSQAIEAKARAVLDLTEFKGQFYLSILKCKASRDEKKNSKRLEFDQEFLIFRDTGETVLRVQIGLEVEASTDWSPLFRGAERMKKADLAESYQKVSGRGRSAAFGKIKTAIDRGDLHTDDFGNVLNPGIEITPAPVVEAQSTPSKSPNDVDGLDKPKPKVKAHKGRRKKPITKKSEKE
jgi:hypothetical protein